MRVWTLQPISFYQALLSEKIVYCKPELSYYLQNDEWDLRESYDWMALQMQKRIGPAPPGIKYPLWGWHTTYGKHQKPDLRRKEFREHVCQGQLLCLECSVPDSQILLSDELAWYAVINHTLYLPENEYSCSAYFNWMALPNKEKDRVMRESWEKIFQINNPCEFIQATFWCLSPENIQAVWPIKRRSQ